jgi:dCMP deaminase
MTDTRPSWEEYFLGIAYAVAARGDCTRRQVGAVLVDPETHDLIETGYNGAPAGMPGCLSAGACPRGRHFHIGKTWVSKFGSITRKEGWCACGNEWPCDEAVPPGSSYDTGPGACIAIHAEANALLRAGKKSRGAHLYLTTAPCDGCLKLIRGAGVVRVIWTEGSLNL